MVLLPQHELALNWDEVDYVAAARKGVVTNLLESGSLSIPAYLRFAYDKATDATPRLPAGYEEADDPFKLRHGHSPLVVAAMSVLGPGSSERGQRLVQMAGAVALTAVVVIGFVLMAPRFSWAGLVVVLLVLPWVNWHMFRDVQFHGWLAVWLAASAVCFAQWLQHDRHRGWALALCASLALAVLTLESGLFLIVAVLASLVVFVRGLRRRSPVRWVRSYALPGLVIVSLATFVLWPGSVLKGSLLKIPLERAYQALGPGDVYYINRNTGDSLTYVLPVIIVALALGLLAVRHRERAAHWGPPALVGLVYGLLVIKFAVNETYFLPAVVPFIMLLGCAVALSSAGPRAVVVTVVAVLALIGARNVLRLNDSDRAADRVLRADFAFVGTYVGTSPALLDGGHIFRHYVGSRQIVDVSYNAKELLLRERGEYEPVAPAELRGKVVGILTERKRAGFLRSEAAEDLTARCPRTDRPTVVLWDCR